MKRYLIAFVLIFSTLPAFADVSVYFSPFDDCEAQFIKVIESAKKNINVSCFGLTNERIYKALVAKRKAGVKVLVCEDKMQSGSKHDYRDQMKKNGIEVVVKKIHVLEHNKMISVDDESGIIGSWNLSGNAQKQDNSIVVFMNEPDMAKQIHAAITRIYNRDKT